MISRITQLFGRAPQKPASVVPAAVNIGPIAPADTLPILTPQALLQARGEVITKIEETAGTTRQHFADYYLPALLSFANWVQQCPASEAHHHAHAGGLLDHALEVASTALKIRLGYLLPPGAPPEEISKRQDIWTYAVFTAALMHDVAKPAVDLNVTVFDREGQTWRWNPWLGSLGDNPNALWYRIEFIRKRQYRLHEKASLLLAHRILPPKGLAWLAEDREAFAAWLACVNSEAVGAGVLGEILTSADGQSVARNLGAEPSPRAAKSTVIPLQEKLITGLRYLIDQGELPLNRNGAAGWRVGDEIWLVSKRVADTLRAHLTLAGHSGIPSNNDRLFDVLQDHAILIPNEERAIWRAVVSGEGWSHPLTLVRVPASKIWPDSNAWPDEFPGTLVVTVTTEPESETTGVEDNSPEPQDQPSESKVSAKKSKPKINPKRPDNPFLEWLKNGLSSGSLPFNGPGARVHVVQEGALLVSPAVFQDYVTQTDESKNWNAVQRRFLEMDLHARSSDGLNIHRYHIESSGDSITGLIVDASLLWDVPPPINPKIIKNI